MRELEKSQREWEAASKKEQAARAKEMQKQLAADEVAQFEGYCDLIVSLHQESGETWDWRAVALTPPPPEPIPRDDHEQRARSDIESYVPGFFERLFGGAKAKQQLLVAALEQARSLDRGNHQTALATYRASADLWRMRAQLAPRVLQLEFGACRDALEHAGAFDELASLQVFVALEAVVGDLATVRCSVDDDEIVPTEELKLTAAGKVSSKEMAQGKYWALYQDHVCSAALRVARETFAVLPVARVIVNTHTRRLNTSTGHNEQACILAAQFTRRGIASLNLSAIDPSDAMKNFSHRMKFKKSTGFDVVERTTDQDQWITT